MDRRQQILETALDCFLRKGFHGTSTREICRTAQISSGLIFHYFASKEAIFEELVRFALATLAPDIEQARGRPLAYLEGFVGGVLTMLAEQPSAAKLFLFANQANYQRDISPVVAELFESHDLIRQFQPIIIAGQEAAEVRAGDPRALTVALLTALQGLAEERAINPHHPLPEAEWYLDIVRNGSKA